MAYDRDAIFEQAKNAIKENDLIWVDEIFAFLPCSKTSFYTYFPADSDELNELKGLIAVKRISLKSELRKKWFKSEAPALQVGLMKLLGTEEESHRLNGSVQKIDHTTGGDKINSQKIDYSKLSDSTLRELADATTE